MFLLIFLSVISLVSVIFFYKKPQPPLSSLSKWILTILRFTSIVIVLIFLINPVWTFRTEVQHKPEIIFLIDNSESMDLLTEGIPKSEYMTEYVKYFSEQYETANYHVREFSFADGIDGSRVTTNLSKALTDLSSEGILRSAQSVYLFSDGWLKDPSLAILNRINIPVNTILIDHELDIRDLSIINLRHNQTMYKDEENIFIAEVQSSEFSGSAEVRFFVNGNEISKKAVNISANEVKQVSFQYEFGNIGLHELEVTVESDDSENLILDNNTMRSAVQVLNNRTEILIIADYMDWDLKFLSNSVSKNPRRSSSFLTFRRNQLFYRDERVNLSEKLKSEVNTLIIINYGSLNFNQSQVSVIEQYVRNGGGLIFMGEPLGDLSEMLPANASNVRQRFRDRIFLTRESSRFQTFNNLKVENIPPVDYYYVNPKVHALILARMENMEQSPAILFSQYERGRVLQFSFLNFWRWQLRDSSSTYHQFFDNIFSWISNPIEDNFISVLDKNLFLRGETVRIKLFAYDEFFSFNSRLNPLIQIHSDDQMVVEDYLSLGDEEYFIELSDLDTGEYHYSITSDVIDKRETGEFIISEDGLEKRDFGFNNPLLQYISNITGGKTHTDDSVLDISKADFNITYTSREISIYRKWYMILLFLTCFCLELFLRKKWGLL